MVAERASAQDGALLWRTRSPQNLQDIVDERYEHGDQGSARLLRSPYPQTISNRLQPEPGGVGQLDSLGRCHAPTPRTRRISASSSSPSPSNDSSAPASAESAEL